LKDKTASEIVKYYSRRFTIEEFFRDTKNLHFRMGLSPTHIRRSDRRDRLLFLVAIAELLFVLLGAANEACGLDKTMGSDHTKKRNAVADVPGTDLLRSDTQHERRSAEAANESV
jgi:hypothetical protein